MLSRDLKWYGGVVNFVASLKRNLSDDVEFNQFRIGFRRAKWAGPIKLIIPLIDATRLIVDLAFKKYDAVHVNPSLNGTSVLRDGLFMLILRIMRARNVVVAFHGWDEDIEKKLTENKVLQKMFFQVYSYANHTLVLSERFKRWFVKIGFEERRVHLFTTMFDDAEFSSMSADSGSDKFTVLFLSRLVREKGVYELIDAFKDLILDYPSLKLIFAGTGPEEMALRRHTHNAGLDEEVVFVGYVRGQNKVSVFQSAGMFVFPSYYGEGCPVALLEAMAAGLPVVTTSVGGIPHIVQHMHNGLILKEVSPDTIGSAIRKLLVDDDMRKRFGSVNRAEAWSRYRASIVSQSFKRMYTE